MQTVNDDPEHGYLRQTADGDWMLIPEGEIGEHDELDGEILRSEWMSSKWVALTKKYEDLYYNKYRIEGEIYWLRVVIE